jgi:hypothetical protein
VSSLPLAPSKIGRDLGLRHLAISIFDRYPFDGSRVHGVVPGIEHMFPSASDGMRSYSSGSTKASNPGSFVSRPISPRSGIGRETKDPGSATGRKTRIGDGEEDPGSATAEAVKISL